MNIVEKVADHTLSNPLKRMMAGEIARHPDALMHDPDGAPWPELKGVVGVFFSSRSGSTAVSRFAEQHFELERVTESLNAMNLRTRNNAWKKRGIWESDSLQATLKEHIARTSPAGWFMFKAGNLGILNAQRIGFLGRYGALIQPIYLLRQDILGQALSLFSAQETQKFHSTRPEGKQLREDDFDYARIEALMQTIQAANTFLGAFMTLFAHSPRFLLYEDFEDGDQTSLASVLGATGLPRRKVKHLNARRQVVKATHPLTAIFRQRFMDSLSRRAGKILAEHERFCQKWLDYQSNAKTRA